MLLSLYNITVPYANIDRRGIAPWNNRVARRCTDSGGLQSPGIQIANMSLEINNIGKGDEASQALGLEGQRASKSEIRDQSSSPSSSSSPAPTPPVHERSHRGISGVPHCVCSSECECGRCDRALCSRARRSDLSCSRSWMWSIAVDTRKMSISWSRMGLLGSERFPYFFVARRSHSGALHARPSSPHRPLPLLGPSLCARTPSFPHLLARLRLALPPARSLHAERVPLRTAPRIPAGCSRGAFAQIGYDWPFSGRTRAAQAFVRVL